MQRVQKPNTKPGKRYLENREAKLIENDKTSIFIRGINANNITFQAMKDLSSLKKPKAVVFNRKNDLKPLEDATTLEFFCKKHDASLFMFCSHNKKRPNNLVAGRMFDHQVLDMFEMGIEDYKSMKEFKNAKVAMSTKPILIFSEGFDEPVYKRLKNFFIDFFRGPVVEYINLKGFEHVLMFTLIDNKICFRSYRIALKKSESKAPAVQLEEIGPHMNLVLRRTKLASEDLFKSACKKPKQLKPKKVKNVKRDVFGSTHGQIHMERQDYSKLQTRKVKGLKKRRFEKVENSQSEPGSKKMKPENVSES